MYVQLTEVESVFRAMKSELAIRPVWHWVASRVEAHVMVEFLGYRLWVSLKQKLKTVAPGLTSWRLPDQFSRIVQVEVWFKLRGGGAICLPRITQTEPAQAILLDQLGWSMPEQPPQDLQASSARCVDNLKCEFVGFPKKMNKSLAESAKVRLALPLLPFCIQLNGWPAGKSYEQDSSGGSSPRGSGKERAAVLEHALAGGSVSTTTELQYLLIVILIQP